MIGLSSFQFKDGDLSVGARPNSLGRFGNYGGQYVPETLIPALVELEKAADSAWRDSSFVNKLNGLLRSYVAPVSLISTPI